MASASDYYRPRFGPAGDLSSSSMSKVDDSVYFTDEQTNAPIDLQTHPTPSDSLTMNISNNPPSQESPLVPDLGSTSDSSLFAPTPIQTPQDFQEPWILQARDTEEEFGPVLSLDGAWDPSQGPRKYRMLAPKPMAQGTGPAARRMQQPEFPFEGTSQNASSTIGQSSPLAQSSGFVAQEQPFGSQEDAFAPELLSQQPVARNLGASVSQQTSTHFWNDDNARDSTQFAHRQTVTNPSHNGELNPFHGPDGYFGSSLNESNLAPGQRNDLGTFSDNTLLEYPSNSFSSGPFAHSNGTAQTSTFAPHSYLDSLPTNTLDRQAQTDWDSSGLPSQPFVLPTNQSSNDAQPAADYQHLGDSETSWTGLEPTGPWNMSIRNGFPLSPFNMQPTQSPGDVAMPALSLDEDEFFGQATQPQPWNGDIGDMAHANQNDPDSVHPNPDETINLDFLPLGQMDPPTNMAPYPTDGTRNASLTTNTVKTNEVGRRDTSRDQQLLELKNSGLSYKEIKERYNFPEAESTLRGRYRTLTKTREDRVRKPEWKPADISALVAAVHSLAQANGITDKFVWADGLAFLEDDAALAKVSWKKVAEMMHQQGCYLYGNATTKKKYVEIRGEKLGQ